MWHGHQALNLFSINPWGIIAVLCGSYGVFNSGNRVMYTCAIVIALMGLMRQMAKALHLNVFY
jgi:hypothetical protein